MAYDYELAIRYRNEILNATKRGEYNLILHKHLGDVFYAIGLAEQFYFKYKKNLWFVVRPKHEFLMRIWKVNRYIVYDLDKIVKKNDQLIKNYFGPNKPKSDELDRLENEFFQSLFSSVPNTEFPFVCESPINNFFTYNNFFCYRWATNLGLNEDFKYEIPICHGRVTQKIEQLKRKVGKFENCVFIAPEAETAVELPLKWWNLIATEILDRGYKLLVNSSRIRIAGSISLIDNNLSLEEVVYIAASCHSVIALRSGLCDVLVGLGNKMTVIYPALLFRERCSLKIPFKKDTGINEVYFRDWKCSSFCWNGINLTKKIVIRIKISKLKFIFDTMSFLLSQCLEMKERRRYWSNLCGSGKKFPNNNVYTRAISC